MPSYRVPLTLSDHVADLTRRTGELERREQMAVYRDTDSSVITGSTGDPTVSYIINPVDYQVMGNLCFFNLSVFISTISGGSGDVRISLPVTVVQGTTCPVACGGVDLPGTPASLAFLPANGTTYGHVDTVVDNGAASRLQISALANGDYFIISGFYFI